MLASWRGCILSMFTKLPSVWRNAMDDKPNIKINWSRTTILLLVFTQIPLTYCTDLEECVEHDNATIVRYGDPINIYCSSDTFSDVRIFKCESRSPLPANTCTYSNGTASCTQLQLEVGYHVFFCKGFRYDLTELVVTPILLQYYYFNVILTSDGLTPESFEEKTTTKPATTSMVTMTTTEPLSYDQSTITEFENHVTHQDVPKMRTNLIIIVTVTVGVALLILSIICLIILCCYLNHKQQCYLLNQNHYHDTGGNGSGGNGSPIDTVNIALQSVKADGPVTTDPSNKQSITQFSSSISISTCTVVINENQSLIIINSLWEYQWFSVSSRIIKRITHQMMLFVRPQYHCYISAIRDEFLDQSLSESSVVTRTPVASPRARAGQGYRRKTIVSKCHELKFISVVRDSQHEPFWRETHDSDLTEDFKKKCCETEQDKIPLLLVIEQQQLPEHAIIRQMLSIADNMLLYQKLVAVAAVSCLDIGKEVKLPIQTDKPAALKKKVQLLSGTSKTMMEYQETLKESNLNVQSDVTPLTSPPLTELELVELLVLNSVKFSKEMSAALKKKVQLLSGTNRTMMEYQETLKESNLKVQIDVTPLPPTLPAELELVGELLHIAKEMSALKEKVKLFCGWMTEYQETLKESNLNVQSDVTPLPPTLLAELELVVLRSMVQLSSGTNGFMMGYQETLKESNIFYLLKCFGSCSLKSLLTKHFEIPGQLSGETTNPLCTCIVAQLQQMEDNTLRGLEMKIYTLNPEDIDERKPLNIEQLVNMDIITTTPIKEPTYIYSDCYSGSLTLPSKNETVYYNKVIQF